MRLVRAAPPPRRHTAPMPASRWLRRGLVSPVHSFVSLALLAVALLSHVPPNGVSAEGVHAFARVIGDSVVPTQSAWRAGPPARWLDTLRIVEFVLRGSSVHAAAVLGDFNRWKRGATQLVAVGNHEWRALALVPRDAVRVAYLVNNRVLLTGEPLTAR